MKIDNNYPNPFPFRYPQQKRIYENLALIGSGPASFYRDACYIMENTNSFHSPSHLVGHLMREIESAIRDVLEPLEGENITNSKNNKTDSKDSKKKQIERILRSFGLDKDEQIYKIWFALSDKLHKFAHRRGLGEPRPITDEFKKEWNDFQNLLDNILEKLRESFLNYFDILDNLLKIEHPNNNDVKLLTEKLPQNSIILGYFFGKCENPNWIAPLRKKGWFNNPPKPIPNEEKRTIQFPFWPQSQYLARMAKKIPNQVLEVILEIPDTGNIRIYEDLVDAALNMPAELAANLVEKAKSWASSPYQHRLPEKLGALLIHLSNGGKVDQAIELARVLLEILPDPRFDGTSRREDRYYNSPEPKTRFEIWLYEEILKKLYPHFVRAARIPALELLCDLLETAICLSRKNTDEHSHIWRRSIEEHPHYYSDAKNILVTAIRDAALLLVRENKANVKEIVNILENRSLWVFKRIAVHLLHHFPNAAPDLIISQLTNRTLFDNPSKCPEYVRLLSEHFGNLPLEQRQKILDWIETGPDVQLYIKRREQNTGKRPTDKEVESYRKHWQRERLAWIKSHLPEDWKSRYESLVTELGEPDCTNNSTTVWVGPTSPIDTEVLRQMSVAEIVEFLSTWKPSHEPMAPSPEGLGRILATVVSEVPERFAIEAERFKGLDATYVRSFLHGLCDALKQNRTFEWTPVLNLCQWVVNQPRDIPRRKNEIIKDADPHWGWTRTTIARLLSEGFKSGAGAIPYKYRERVWAILDPLTSDPDPTPEDEAQNGGENIDPATLSINTTRGTAMHAVLQYALWVYSHLKYQNKNRDLNNGLKLMPEVRKVLQEHLDIAREPSLAVRSVYGQWFPWLVLLDEGWTTEHVHQIFPYREKLSKYYNSAWESYIVFCYPDNKLFSLLRKQYATAVEQLGVAKEEKRLIGDPVKRLAEHLMILYWSGSIDINDPILQKFWSNASKQLKAYALSFVGRNLDKIPDQFLERLKTLWESRLATAKEATAYEDYADELAEFGWWFVSGKFDNEWALEQLIEALEISKKIENAYSVTEQLNALVDVYPTLVIQCVEKMAKGDQEDRGIYLSLEHIKEILAKCLQNPDLGVRRKAEALVHYLGSCGFLQFRDLIQSDQ